MIPGLVLLLAIAVVVFLLLYFANNLEEEHAPLRLLVFILAFSLLLFVPKVAVDNEDHCNLVVANQTVVGNITSFEYTYQCAQATNNTARLFLRGYTFWLVVFAMYLLITFSKEIIDFLKGVLSTK